jgi:hypothetical protein
LDPFPGFLDPFKTTVDECEVIGKRFQDVLNQCGCIGAVDGGFKAWAGGGLSGVNDQHKKHDKEQWAYGAALEDTSSHWNIFSGKVLCFDVHGGLGVKLLEVVD